jgi:hypothetical protein
MLWTVPAKVQGLWCGAGPLKSLQFDVKQSFQTFSVTMTHGTRVREYAGRIEGNMLHSLSGARTQMQLRLQGEQLVLVRADGALGLLKGSALQRATGGRCAG